MAFFRFVSFALAVFFLSQSLALADDLKLPPPKTEGGVGIFEALKKRSSVAGGDFSPAELSNEELSTILWAASGLNRGEQGWTVPMAMGRPPYCKIYVAAKDGVWLYDWANHALKEVSKDNVKALVGSQAFVRRASHILIIVSDPLGLSTFSDPATQDEFAFVLTGAMTQNVYLAATGLNLGARYIHDMRIPEIVSSLKLGPGEKPICLMLVGK
ncbi:MAG: nitroreductase family protein [Deltaproteobacteria bacterium]|jgi:hypothetical protein|nr:nitroreductase family protein [Deltaproteobacteria bacterium]